MSETRDIFYSWASQNQVSDVRDLMNYVEELEMQKMKLEGLNTSWPLREVLRHLIWATEYLLNDKCFDGHYHEELNICANKGRGYLQLL